MYLFLCHKSAVFDVARQRPPLPPLTATEQLWLQADANRGGLPQNTGLVTFVDIW